MVWLENVVGVSFDAVKKVVISRGELVSDGRDVVAGVSEPFSRDAAANQDARGRQPSTFPTTLAPHIGSARRLWHEIRHAATWSACRVRAAHAWRTADWNSTIAVL